MERIRTRLGASGFTADQISEITEGAQHRVDIAAYADRDFLAIQMRQIRLGLEKGLDVSVYADKAYDWFQMEEIRFGLEEGLDVSYFRSLMYTAADMEQRRLALQEHPGLAVSSVPEENDGPELVRITLAEDNTAAYADLCGELTETARVEILQALHRKGITYGIRYDDIDRMVSGEGDRMHVLVARGVMPVHGKDGYYEYFFRTHVARTPKTLADGYVDYRNVDWFEKVKKGQKLAFYHRATTGKNGMTVTGKEIPARKGREQCILTGRGFQRAKDGKTYFAELDGIVTLAENDAGTDVLQEIKLEVTDLLTVSEVTLATGDVQFDGSVFVTGNVGSGVSIHAAGDVLVDGFVEAAHITCGGDVMLRRGMNAAYGEGIIQAAGDVNGYFFEAVEVTAGGNIHGDYFLNCELHAAGRIDVMGKKGSLTGGRASAALEQEYWYHYHQQ